jgi:hypothetical protein
MNHHSKPGQKNCENQNGPTTINCAFAAHLERTTPQRLRSAFLTRSMSCTDGLSDDSRAKTQNGAQQKGDGVRLRELNFGFHLRIPGIIEKKYNLGKL